MYMYTFYIDYQQGFYSKKNKYHCLKFKDIYCFVFFVVFFVWGGGGGMGGGRGQLVVLTIMIL